MPKEKEHTEIIFPHANINIKPFGDTFHAKNSLIGGYIDRRLADLASLYCVYTQQSKTDFIKEIIQEKAKEFPSEKQMMDGICKMHLDYWVHFLESQEVEDDIQYEYRKKKLWTEYKNGLIKDLNKIIPKYYTNYVINYIQEAQF